MYRAEVVVRTEYDTSHGAVGFRWYRLLNFMPREAILRCCSVCVPIKDAKEKCSLENMKEDIAKKRNKAERLPTEGGQSYSQGVNKSRCVLN